MALSTRKSLLGRLAGGLVGALAGYMVGWIVGWSLFDPETDVWALAAAVVAIAGLVYGVMPGFWQRAGALLGAAAGLYLGWVLRTLLFGDVPGGWGVLLVLGAGVAGGWIGAQPAFGEGRVSQRVLLSALLIGFFGGFLVDVVLLDLVLGLVQTHSILGQAPAVLACAVGGGALGAWTGHWKTI